MTDFTNNRTWSDQEDTQTRARSTEYQVYFALILLAAVPICAVLWIYALVRHATLPAQGPLKKAWSEAQSITPRIFWG